MLTTLTLTNSEFEVKGSRFLSFLVPAADFSDFVLKMRQDHPKAVHFVTAARIWQSGQITESFSDDGEPKGTSGMPTLKVLRGYELINCGLLSIRYFGGTLLGTGGLVRAYTQGARDVVLCAKERDALEAFVELQSASIEVDFAHLSQAQYLAKMLQVSLTPTFNEHGATLQLSAPQQPLNALLSKLEELKFQS